MHSPQYGEEIAEARRLGGLRRRRREVALAGAYEFNGLVSVADLRRLLEIAALDTPALSATWSGWPPSSWRLENWTGTLLSRSQNPQLHQNLAMPAGQ